MQTLSFLPLSGEVRDYPWEIPSPIPNGSPRSASQVGKVDRTRRIIAPEMGTQAVRLSTREGEVASLVAEGLTNGAIAARLFISERTVESHLERIRRKLGFHHRS